MHRPVALDLSLQALAPSEREVVIAQLSESFAQDRLSLGEFEHRVAAAYRATTVADLTVDEESVRRA